MEATNEIIDTLRTIDPTATTGIVMTTCTGVIFGQLGGITVRRDYEPYGYRYCEYRVDLAPDVRVEYRDEPRKPTLAVFPTSAVLAVRDTTPRFDPCSEHYLGFSETMW